MFALLTRKDLSCSCCCPMDFLSDVYFQAKENSHVLVVSIVKVAQKLGDRSVNGCSSDSQISEYCSALIHPFSRVNKREVALCWCWR